MPTVKYVYWQEDDAWLGYLQEYPDYWTQGETLADLSGGHIPGARRVGELTLP